MSDLASKNEKTNYTLYWIIFFLTIFTFLYAISAILLPFVVGAIAAYFLDPAADKLEEFGLSRTFSTTAITVTFFTILILLGVLLTPVLYEQFLSFISKIPEYISYINENILPRISKLMAKIDESAIENIQGSLKDISKFIFSFISDVAGNLWNSGMALVNILSLIFITPVVTFYMLRDWDKMLDKIKNWLPEKHKTTILDQFGKINTTLSGYIRGQTNVCILLAAFYCISLAIAGLDFALFVGITTGILSFIPYVGAIFGFVVSTAIAFFQFGDLTNIIIIVSIFFTGQILEGAFISPNLVGNKVGLHPLWIIFGMFAGGNLFGFVGVLLAIPVTAIIGVIARFSLEKYLQSSLYKERKRKKTKN